MFSFSPNSMSYDNDNEYKHFSASAINVETKEKTNLHCNSIRNRMVRKHYTTLNDIHLEFSGMTMKKN